MSVKACQDLELCTFQRYRLLFAVSIDQLDEWEWPNMYSDSPAGVSEDTPLECGFTLRYTHPLTCGLIQ